MPPYFVFLNTRPIQIKFLCDCSQESKNKVLTKWEAIEATESKSIGECKLLYNISDLLLLNFVYLDECIGMAIREVEKRPYEVNGYLVNSKLP